LHVILLNVIPVQLLEEVNVPLVPELNSKFHLPNIPIILSENMNSELLIGTWLLWCIDSTREFSAFYVHHSKNCLCR